MLELQLQHGEDDKVEYAALERLVGIYHDLVETKLLTSEEYAKSENKKVKDIKQDIEKAI